MKRYILFLAVGRRRAFRIGRTNKGYCRRPFLSLADWELGMLGTTDPAGRWVRF